MQFLQKALDDPHAAPCGICAHCAPKDALPIAPAEDTVLRARDYLRRGFIPIAVRKMLPQKSSMTTYGWSFTKIPEEFRPEAGWALSWYRFDSIGNAVHAQRYCEKPHYDDRLAAAAAEMIRKNLNFKEAYLTCVPSLGNPNLVPDLTQRLASALKIPYYPIIKKAKQTKPQKEMLNGQQQVQNLDGVFAVELPAALRHKPVILVDDICNSGWTFTICAVLLRQAGAGAVYPVALAKS